MFRQGDLLFIRHDAGIPSGMKMKHDRVVLGSTITGHDHKLTKGVVYVNENPNWENRANFYISIPEKGSSLVHPEHKTIKIPEGNYQVIRQREVSGYVRD